MLKRFSFLAIIGLFVFLSCSNDLDLLDDYRDTPVVYAFITPADTAQYFRIERGFVDESTPALEIAQIADSLYYENLVVKLKRISTGEEYLFQEVDGNTEGFVREDGAFAQSPNTLYKINTIDLNLVEEEEYQLIIERGDSQDVVTATTTVIKDPFFVFPTASSNTIGFLDGRDTDFSWRNNENALIHDVSMEITVTELTGTELVERKLNWVIEKNIKSDKNTTNLVTASIDGVAFYQFLRENLVENPATERLLSDLSLKVSSGGEEIFQYISVGQANLGITSSQDIPTFSNLSEGRGLFSTVATATLQGVTLKAESVDSLKNGRLTGPLNFR